MTPRIRVSYVYPPIPDRRFDFCATLDSYDGAPDAGFQPIGWGATEAEAIADLKEQLEGTLECTCRLESVNSASIDPPEMIVNEWCPTHGRDPDEELQKQRDR